jgi:hypothetical protein
MENGSFSARSVPAWDGGGPVRFTIALLEANRQAS